MKKLFAFCLLFVFALCAQAQTTPWTLYKGTSIVTPRVAYPDGTACSTAANLSDVPKSTNFFCKNKTVTTTNDKGSVTTTTVDISLKIVVLPKPVMPTGMVYVDMKKVAAVPRAIGIDYDNFAQNPPGTPVIQFPNPSSDQTGDFRTVALFSHFAFDDPIVYPGQPGKSHLHAFFGNTGTNAFSTAESIANTGNSTSRGGTINRTSYWVPAMIDTKDGSPVLPDQIIPYYKTGYEQVFPADMNDLPAGLRMIAGDPTAKTFAVWSHNGFHCQTPTGDIYNADKSKNGIEFDCPSGSVLWMNVVFPQCWDGKNLDSPDHRSHMAYGNIDGAAARNGGPKLGCPTTHPVGLPQVAYNVLYTVKDGAAFKRWRLASDNYDKSLPAGYSAHADWFDGWKQDIVHTFTEFCLKAAKDCQAHMLGDGRVMAGAIASPDRKE